MKSLGKDFKGKELFIGDKVIFCEYQRDSNLYEGVIESETEKTITIGRGNWWKRIVKKDETQNKLLKV